jgi:hypothetical protein
MLERRPKPEPEPKRKADDKPRTLQEAQDKSWSQELRLRIFERRAKE